MIVRNYVLVLLEYHHCCHHRHLPVDQSVILCTKKRTNNSTYSNRQLKLIGYTASFFSTCMLHPMDSLLIILVSTLCSPTGPWSIVFQVFLSFMASYCHFNALHPAADVLKIIGGRGGPTAGAT